MAPSPAASVGRRAEGAEPISPELVLVDPELGRIERARLAEAAASEPVTDLSARPRPPAARRAASAPTPPPSSPARRLARSRKPLLLGALLVVMFASGVYVSEVVMRQHAPATAVVVALTSAARPPVSPASAPAASTAVIPVSAAVEAERAILSRMLRSAKRNLPPQLVDSATGLLKNNVYTRCRRSRHSRSFLCVVQPPARPGAGGLYVRYWPNRDRHAEFAWYGYRNR